MNVLHIHWPSLANPLCALLLAPLMSGVIQWVKAALSGQPGASLLQPYFELWRLLGKHSRLNRTASWVYPLGPIISLAALLLVQFIMPLGSHPGFVSFGGDFVLFVYLLAAARFCLMLAAFDTGSALASLSAARTAFVSMLTEPALLLGLAAVAHVAHAQVPLPATPTLAEAKATAEIMHDSRPIPPAFELSMSHLHALLGYSTWERHGVVLALVACSFFIVLLCENSRMPINDPTTNEELTMIQQGMLFEYAGPDLAFVEYAGALKLWALASLLLGMVTPANTNLWVDLTSALVAMFLVAVLIGALEARIARWRLVQSPRLLLGAVLISAVALAIEYGYGA